MKNKDKKTIEIFSGDRCGYREHADVNAAKNIRNNLISTAAKPKVEQALCQYAECVEKSSDASHQPCAGGN